MKVFYSPHFKRDYKPLPREIKRKFKKQIKYLLENFWHPSLRCKKYDAKRGIWQARVNRYYRFYFLIKGDTYILLEIKPNPK
jgi:mRNA-degrading endonuclease RelE of RelBE toxin-antitoxin system